VAEESAARPTPLPTVERKRLLLKSSCENPEQQREAAEQLKPCEDSRKYHGRRQGNQLVVRDRLCKCRRLNNLLQTDDQKEETQEETSQQDEIFV
jgi:hypothetical protein